MRHKMAIQSEFAFLAKLLGVADGSWRQVSQISDRIEIPANVRAVVKAAVAAGGLSDIQWAGALAPYAAMTESFLESGRSISIFLRFLDSGMIEAPLRTHLAAASGGFTASEVEEGRGIGLTRLSLTESHLEQRRASGIAMFTKELLSNASPAAIAFVERELRKAVAEALDRSLLEHIQDDSTPLFVASGTDAEAALADLRKLLDIVNTTGSGALFWLFSPDVANRAATLAGMAGNLVFPGMSPQGGEILNVPALVSDTVPVGSIMLVDASGLVGGIENITLSVSDAAAVQMLSSPTNDGVTPTPNTLVSLWQTNSRALKVDCYHGVQRGRDNSVAILKDISWGTEAAES